MEERIKGESTHTKKINQTATMLYADLAALRTEALEFFVAENVLTFGDFTLKSGRKSPYFFNTGSLCSGRQLATMGKLYAGTIEQIAEFADAPVVFGSAYKGIPIAVATAMMLAGDGDEERRAVSDRKEAKTHGDVSGFLGVIRAGDTAVIVDDVITTGGTKLEAIEKLRAAGCTPLGFVIAFDRCEPIDDTGRTAREAFQQQTGLPVYPILSVHDIIETRPELGARLRQHLDTFATGIA
ncbi:MAG: orotate phosphoribosyltransferase [Chlorobi bacterium CHB2]|nr:orotate phosphoribosyltransferase [Chlorobi bacterium CHB2]